QSLASLDTWEEQNIFVVGADRLTEGVEVSLVVSDRGRIVNSVKRSWKVEDLLRSEVRHLERTSLMKVEVIRDESCAREPCPYYQKCRQTLKHVNAFEVYQTDSFMARTLKTRSRHSCASARSDLQLARPIQAMTKAMKLKRILSKLFNSQRLEEMLLLY
ncbi:hypothetical protein OSTOST_11101, partial [Ostertagia ostertagi]